MGVYLAGCVRVPVNGCARDPKTNYAFFKYTRYNLMLNNRSFFFSVVAVSPCRRHSYTAIVLIFSHFVVVVVGIVVGCL